MTPQLLRPIRSAKVSGASLSLHVLKLEDLISNSAKQGKPTHYPLVKKFPPLLLLTRLTRMFILSGNRSLTLASSIPSNYS
jgi:hypothetical protein